MLPYNRRMLMSRQFEHKSAENQNNNSDSNDIHINLKNSINTISNNINEIKKSISQIEKKLEHLEDKQAILENRIDDDYCSRNNTVSNNLLDIRNELELIKKETNKTKHQYSPSDSGNRPIMPGSGFAGITEEYLKNLHKNNLP
ncbi:MAG: hypothetical protein GX660_08695 [Clostridiaceae bacterium]|nr:hypothetical protein [Clostridiaceae bacterium]